MLFSNAAEKPAHLTETQEITRDAGHLMARKIWLPKALYVALPYFYLVAGVCALLATIYISAWVWLLPHYLLFAVACLHLGLTVYRRRRRSKNRP
jgi:Flp pilus assembly protein TadB